MIIDSHLHMATAEPGRRYYPERQSWSVSMGWAYSGQPPYQKDPKTLVDRHQLRISDPEGKYSTSSMDYAGVDASVILPVDYDLVWGQESDISIEEKHQHLAGIAKKYPGRYYPFAGPDPRRLDAFNIFKRAIDEYGLHGFKLIPGCGYYPWDERIYPFYELCLDRGIPVFTCTQASAGSYRYVRFAEPMHVGDMLSEFPDLTVVMLHGGFPHYHWFEEAMNVAAGCINAYIELDFWIYGIAARPNALGTAPNIISDEEAIVKMLARAKGAIGMHRILWGTDSHQGPNFYDEHSVFHFGMKRLVDWWKDLPETGKKYGCEFTQEDVDLVLGGNVARILGIEKGPEWEIKDKYGWRRRYPSPNKS